MQNTSFVVFFCGHQAAANDCGGSIKNKIINFLAFFWSCPFSPGWSNFTSIWPGGFCRPNWKLLEKMMVDWTSHEGALSSYKLPVHETSEKGGVAPQNCGSTTRCGLQTRGCHLLKGGWQVCVWTFVSYLWCCFSNLNPRNWTQKSTKCFLIIREGWTWQPVLRRAAALVALERKIHLFPTLKPNFMKTRSFGPVGM